MFSFFSNFISFTQFFYKIVFFFLSNRSLTASAIKLDLFFTFFNISAISRGRVIFILTVFIIHLN